MKINMLLCAVLILSSHLHASEYQVSIIEEYNPCEHLSAIKGIINDSPHYLSYEYINAGKTEHYLEKHNYSTQALRINEKTIGFINYIKENKHIYPTTYTNAGIIHLLGIKKEFQHRGYGQQLLFHALRELQKISKKPVFVSVNKTNEAAKKLYTKVGFIAVATQKVQDIPHIIYQYN